MSVNFYDKINNLVDGKITGGSTNKEVQYLSTMAPNAIEFVVRPDMFNMPTTYNYPRQYQIIRDMFNLRCVNCNSQDPEAIDAFDKTRSYLESEVLLTWKDEYQDFTCPKCGNTLAGFVDDGLVTPFNEGIIVCGMRAGKSYSGAEIGGYTEHVLRVLSMKGKGSLQRYLHQAPGEWFDCTYAAATATQAKDTIFSKYRSMRNNSPWIQRHVAWVKEQEALQVGSTGLWEYKELDDTVEDGWLQVRFNRVSSNSAGIAGRTRIFATIDELSRLSTSESKNSAQELYRVLNQSLKTVRGALRHHNLCPVLGYMLNTTSPISLDDAAMLIYNQTMAGERRRTYAWKGATWEFTKALTREDFDDEYEKDPVGAERDFGANPPAAETPLIHDTLRFWKSIDASREAICQFKPVHITDKTNKQYVGAKLETVNYNFVDQHYMFLDASETFDSFALSIGHPVILPDDTLREDLDLSGNGLNIPDQGTHISQLGMHPDSPMAMGLPRFDSPNSISAYRNPLALGNVITVMDACYRIIPTKERDIHYQSILDIITELQKKIKIAAVCYDSWNSVAHIQAIRDLGIQSYKVRLRNEHFLKFVSHVYNDKISLLPPLPEDHFSLSDTGILQIGKQQQLMSGQGIGLLELLKLERSPDLKKVLAPKKGLVRGANSDDIARTIIGVNTIIKDSFVNNLQDSGQKRERRKNMIAMSNSMKPQIFKGGH